MRALALGCALALVGVARADFEVYFLRHGETTWNRAKILQGSTPDTQLTPRGVRMAQDTARGFAAQGIAFDRLFASPYTRARETAALATAGTGLVPTIDPRLREMGFGIYEGKRCLPGAYCDDNLRRFFEDTDTFRPTGAGAESLDQVRARLRAFCEEALKPLDGKVRRVLCVSHALVLRAVLMEFAGEGGKPILPNCCVHVLRYSNGRFSVVEKSRVFYDPKDYAQKPPRLVAHRGAGDLDMAEATRAAYSNAVATASDIVKLDLQRTKDGVIVMGHDPSLKRVMGWDALITNLTYAAILEKGRFPAKGAYPAETIVRLDEALPIVRRVPEFWIDFKYFDPDFAERVVAAFRREGIDPSRVMVATFNLKALAYFQKHHPKFRRVRHVGKITAKSAARYREELGLFGFNVCVLKHEASPELIRALKGMGLWVSLWFVQNEKMARDYRASGADAYVTDYASAVRRGLFDKD